MSDNATSQRYTSSQKGSSGQRLSTPGHAAAAASLALTSPSRLSRVSLSPAQTSNGERSSSAVRGVDEAAPFIQGSTSDHLAQPTSALSLSVASSQELDPFGHQDANSSTLTNTKAAPSISVDLAEFPPARRRTTPNDEDGTALDKEDKDGHDAAPLTTPKRPKGVDFLTQRLRSAIGQELLIEDVDGVDDETRHGPVGSASNSSVREGGDETGQARHSQRQSEQHDMSKNESKKSSEGVGWSWATLTTIPAALRMDGALQGFAKQGRDSSLRSSPAAAKSTSNQESGKAVGMTAATATMNYMNALDVRRWFAAEQEEDKAEGAKKGKSTKKDEGKDANSATIVPSSPLRGMPVGSYPSSSVASRKKKEAGRAQNQAQVAMDKEEKSRKEVGGNAKDVDLTHVSLGVENDGDEEKTFAPHEYLVLSTAGKPVFGSKVSKARLERAKVNRRRKRAQQDLIDVKRKDGIDVTKEVGEIEKREEELSQEEQSLQDEEDQTEATRVGLLQAIISNFAESDRDKLHATAKEVLGLPHYGKVCFLLRPPLYLVAVSRWNDAESALRNHLDYLYQAIISLVSATKLNRLFDRAANFDLRRLLQGTDNILDALLTRMQGETIAMRGALQPLRLDAALRHDVGAALLPSRSTNARPQDALYALLLTRKGIVTLARRRKIGIHPTDCHLLINTVLATKALKEGGTQTWVPICLPKFAPQGFVYAHVSFLDDEVAKGGPTSSSLSSARTRDGRPELGLVLITGNPEGFEDMSAWRERIVGFLHEGKLLESVLRVARMVGRLAPPNVSLQQEPSNSATAPSSYSADELGLAGLRHFCFKWRSNVQSTSPSFEDPYAPGSVQHRRLLHLYDLAYDTVARASKEKDATARSGLSPAQSDGETKVRSADESETTDDASSSRAASILDRGRKGADATMKTTTPSSTSSSSKRASSPPIVARSVMTGQSAPKTKQQEGMLSASSAASAFVDAVRGASFSGASTASTTMYIFRTPSETVFAWSTQPFELYMTASPHLSRASLVTMAKAVVRWVKQEEHRLFIVSAPVF